LGEESLNQDLEDLRMDRMKNKNQNKKLELQDYRIKRIILSYPKNPQILKILILAIELTFSG